MSLQPLAVPSGGVMPPLSASPRPVFTLILAVLNGEKTLQRCLDSITCQSYRDFELIVVDGSSTDHTLEILQQNTGCISHWESGKDRGIYHAWNKGLAQAQGDWICFIGVDDVFADCQVLEIFAERLAAIFPPVRVAYGKVKVMASGRVAKTIGMPWPIAKERFRTEMCIPHPGLMHHRCLFETHGGFDESFKISGDYELLLRELKQGDAIFVDDITTVVMEAGGISGRPDNALMVVRETRRAQRKQGYRWPGWRWLFAALKAYAYELLALALGKTLATRITLFLKQRW